MAQSGEAIEYNGSTGYDTKQSAFLKATEFLEPYNQRTPSLPSLPGPLRVVAPDRILYMG